MKLVSEKHIWDARSFPSRLPAGKIRVFARYADRAKSSVLGTRISRRQEALAKKGRKGPETAPWPVSITRLLWLRQWRTLFLAEDVLSRLSPSHGPSLSLASIRDGKRNRTKGTSPIAPQRLPRLPKYLSPLVILFPRSSLPLFLLVLLVFLSSSSLPPLRSSRCANLLGRYVQIETSSWTVFESASLFNFASVASVPRPYLHPAARLFHRFQIPS